MSTFEIKLAMRMFDDTAIVKNAKVQRAPSGTNAQLVAFVRDYAYSNLAVMEEKHGSFPEWKVYVNHPFNWLVNGKTEGENMRLRFACENAKDAAQMDILHAIWHQLDVLGIKGTLQ